jgi:hypothetical protein
MSEGLQFYYLLPKCCSFCLCTPNVHARCKAAVRTSSHPGRGMCSSLRTNHGNTQQTYRGNLKRKEECASAGFWLGSRCQQHCRSAKAPLPLGTDDCCLYGVPYSTWLGSQCQQDADNQFGSERCATEQRLLGRQLRQPCTETIPSTAFLQCDEGIGAVVVHVVSTL